MVKQKGYTLIEILVGLTIVGLIFGVAFITYREFSRRQSLVGATKTLIGDLRLIQEQAISGKKPDELACMSTSRLTGFTFEVVDATSYRVRALCTGGNVDIKTVNLPADLTITDPDPNPILFKSLAEGTNVPAGVNATITVTQSSTGNTNTITISSSGEIK